MKQFVRLPAFAKINLRLDVISRRPDGYHELRTVFQTIGLRDTLELRRTRAAEITLEIEGAELSPGPDNLVYRAIEAIGGEVSFPGGIHARLKKHIPIARGLGGGSSDAAAALVGMLRLTGAKMPLARLVEIASKLGADVPFFLFGGRALAVNRGDEIYPLPDAPKQTIVVVSPKDIGVSTKEAYQWVSEELTNRPEAPKIWGFCALCWSRQGAGVSNDFEGPVFRRHSRLGEIRAELLQGGAADAALAGSGSAVFGVFRNPARARRTARKFPEDSVFVVPTLSRKEYGRALGWSAGG
ncbi:MAG TPA: 4-(cytidine 5'-diphospho)-2-C-methyl-D-erythritol kinase [Candidatus Acidoferrum sp.]|nr:4-(cytidine 5'-diphospho)-2-C-methyl-D-erythritol kinase [Candidatus Acidoferrum sp.]